MYKLESTNIFGYRTHSSFDLIFDLYFFVIAKENLSEN